MENIYDTNDSFDFSKITLYKPTMISGGNYFIRTMVDGAPLYVQPPKCTTKQGIIKSGKRYYSDLMFTNENEQFIRWMENLENHCQQLIFTNRSLWFDGEMELHDIESYFTSPIKLFKSGKYYSARVNVTLSLGKPTLKIYNEDETEIELDAVDDKMNIMSIWEIQGIKCSARSFQIEIELKQMMVLNKINLFEKCVIKSKTPTLSDTSTPTGSIKTSELVEQCTDDVDTTAKTDANSALDETQNMNKTIVGEEVETTSYLDNSTDETTKMPTNSPSSVGMEEMEEIVFNLEELSETDKIQLKQRNEVYYDLYRNAKQKAKLARNLALSAYLEAKRIKNKYLIDCIDDSEDSSETEDNKFDDYGHDSGDNLEIDNDVSRTTTLEMNI